MGRIVVRQHKECKKPYRIPGLQKSVYSLEELVYRYQKNIFSLEEKVVDLDLCDWLEQEMGQEILAAKLREEILSGCGMERFLELIFAGIPFCTEEEMERAVMIFESWAEQNPLEKKIARIENLMEQKENREAVSASLEVLKEAEGDEKNETLLYHNLGVMAAGEFYFDVAAEYFKRAWEIGKREESRKMYMLSLRFSLSKEEYVERIGRENLGEERAVELETEILALLEEEKQGRNRLAFQELLNEYESGNRGLYREKLKNLLHEWKEEWRYG